MVCMIELGFVPIVVYTSWKCRSLAAELASMTLALVRSSRLLTTCL